MAKEFIITIDTEGDNLWSKPKIVTTENAKYLPRFQDLCDKYGFKPTYLTNYEMAIDTNFIKFGKKVILNNSAEIGLHIHAWDSPPINNDYGNNEHQSYMFELPINLLNEKIEFLTKTLMNNFEIQPVSHRAGRWGFDSKVALCLIENNYLVDCSVTPYVSWEPYIGLTQGGSNYENYFEDHYFIDTNDISKKGNSALLEVPVSIIVNSKISHNLIKSFKNDFFQKLIRKLAGIPVIWLRPKENNLEQMKKIVDVKNEQNKYLEFMLHSSEFMPKGSPNFTSNESIEKLFQDMNQLFLYITNAGYTGISLKEFRKKYN